MTVHSALITDSVGVQRWLGALDGNINFTLTDLYVDVEHGFKVVVGDPAVTLYANSGSGIQLAGFANGPQIPTGPDGRIGIRVIPPTAIGGETIIYPSSPAFICYISGTTP